VPAWLIISYRVPNEPSALRVATWRALKQLGAVKLGDGAYFLPRTNGCADAMAEIRTRVITGGGAAIVIEADGLDDADRDSLAADFDAARADEFSQVARSAARLVEHIGREESTDDYRFAEVDALEEELEKVRRQFQRVVDRDYLASPVRETAASALSEADDRLRRYLDEAFRRENGLPERSEHTAPAVAPVPLRRSRTS
jgi:hypothetical protein